MPKRLRALLVLVGLLIVLCSLVALAYAFWPVDNLSEQVPLAPTLFSPP